MVPAKVNGSVQQQPAQDLGPATALNYRKSRNAAQRAYDKADPDDRKVISGMISDCEYSMEWLETGRRPGNKRGIERRSAYQREILIDPLRMQAYVQRSSCGSPANISEYERYQIEDALCRLSARERECYVLAHGECFSFSEIAGMLGIAKGSVEEYVQRAQQKVSEELDRSLFLI